MGYSLVGVDCDWNTELFQNQRGRRNTMFGVDFQEQVEHYKSQVPPIITKCLAEIERRGVMIKVGILRALVWCVPFTMNIPMQISCACRHVVAGFCMWWFLLCSYCMCKWVYYYFWACIKKMWSSVMVWWSFSSAAVNLRASPRETVNVQLFSDTALVMCLKLYTIITFFQLYSFISVLVTWAHFETIGLFCSLIILLFCCITWVW